MSLEPVVEVGFPKHVMWARHRADISATDDMDRWWSRISSAKMSKNGVVSILLEQDKLMSFKAAEALKLKGLETRSDAIKNLFSLDREVHVEEKLLKVHDSIAVIIDTTSWSELDAIVDAGTEALQQLEAPECIDLKTVVAFRTFPAGKEIIQRCKLFVQKVCFGLNPLPVPPSLPTCGAQCFQRAIIRASVTHCAVGPDRSLRAQRGEARDWPAMMLPPLLCRWLSCKPSWASCRAPSTP